jgi:uncharacterized membrane protein YsdA (DUF1294 family)
MFITVNKIRKTVRIKSTTAQQTKKHKIVKWKWQISIIITKVHKQRTVSIDRTVTKK